METIGFSLYMELLENAVDALKAGREPSREDRTRPQTEVELRMPSLLPDDFIPDVNTRLSFNKRIASAKTENELEEIKVELIDRFGLLPDPARNLLDVARLLQQAQKLGIRKLQGNEKGGVIEFARKAAQSAETAPVVSESETVDPRKAAVEAAIARAKARKAAQNAVSEPAANDDPRKAAVAAAIARVQARKAAQAVNED